MEVCNPSPQKEIIINQLQSLGYKENTKIIDGNKEITEYTKSFLSYSFISKGGEGEYPLLLTVDFQNQNPQIYGDYKNANAMELIFSALADKMANVRHKDKEKPYDVDKNLLILDTNIDGVRYLEEALEKLGIPEFNIKLSEMKNSSYGKLLQELGYRVGKDDLNDFLTGHSEYIDVVYAPITKITDKNKDKVPFPWKAKILSKIIRQDKSTYRKFKGICNNHGSFENRNKSVNEDDGIVTRRFNLKGLIEVTEIFQSQPDNGQTTPQNPK